jgi:integrase
VCAAVVDERFLPSDQQRDDLLAWIGQRPRHGRPLRAFLSSIAFAALRPQEALALRVRDAHLPDEGPGDLVIHPRRLRGRDEGAEDEGVPRVVPACPELVEVLTAEVARRCLRPDDALFTRDDGRPLSRAVYRRAWREAREAVLEAHEIDSPLGRRVSDLRDACISTWLGGYRTAFEVFMVAERVGVSAPSLARRFPHCFQASGEVSYDLMEAAFAMTDLECEPKRAARNP